MLDFICIWKGRKKEQRKSVSALQGRPLPARGRLRQWQAFRADMESAPTSPLKLKLHLFRQVCRGRIVASRAVYPLYRMIGTAAAGGIVAVPTSQPILFILVYGRGRGMPRPYQPIKTKSKALELPRCYSLKPPPARGLFIMPFNSLYDFCRLAAKAKKDFFSLGICVMID